VRFTAHDIQLPQKGRGWSGKDFLNTKVTLGETPIKGVLLLKTPEGFL
jgi:hypothetical protein